MEHYQLARSIISWRGALSAGAPQTEHYQLARSIISWRGGDSTIKNAIVGCRVVCAIYVCVERVRVGLMDYGWLVMSLERNASRLGAAMIMEGSWFQLPGYYCEW